MITKNLRFWTQDGVDAAIRAKKAGRTYSQISEDIGAVSKNAVAGMFYRLAKRITPIPGLKKPGLLPELPKPVCTPVSWRQQIKRVDHHCSKPNCRGTRQPGCNYCAEHLRTTLPARTRPRDRITMVR